MNLKSTKSLLLGSCLALGAIGLSACGDDSTSANNNNEGALIPTATENSASITFVGPGSAIPGEKTKFTGTFKLNSDDPAIENSEELRFIGIDAIVGIGDNPSNLIATNVLVNRGSITFPTTKVINLSESSSAGLNVSLSDAGFTACGTHTLVVTAKALNGTSNDTLSNTQYISFERPESYCATQDPSSSSDNGSETSTEIEMKACEINLVSTNINPGINVATCSAVDANNVATADIVFAKPSNEEIQATSNTGLLFSPIANQDYDVDNWPEPAYVSSFLYRSITGTTINQMVENSYMIYVAKGTNYDEATGAGFYAFGIKDIVPGSNGHSTFTVILYKVQ